MIREDVTVLSKTFFNERSARVFFHQVEIARGEHPLYTGEDDGDTVFAAATGRAGPGGSPPVLTELGTVAADCLARAVARGVYEATALPFTGAVPDWRSRFGGHRGGSRK